MCELDDLILNSTEIIEGKKFAGIIGSNPSKGARSPKLWNAAYEFFEEDIRMYPLDVSLEKIRKLISFLKNCDEYVGGAIAAPFKTEIASLLKENLTREAQEIGAINCLYRDQNGELMGTNTDGEAALKCLQKFSGEINNKNILIMGFGGVGKSVSAYISKVLDIRSNLVIASRKSINISDKLLTNNKFFISFNEIKDYINSTNILINCTSVGWNNQEELCPISIDDLKLLKQDSLVFDVIYQPLETVLIKNAKSIGLKTMNGLEMNKEQAVLAFQYASKKLINSDDKLKLLRKVMENV